MSVSCPQAFCVQVLALLFPQILFRILHLSPFALVFCFLSPSFRLSYFSPFCSWKTLFLPLFPLPSLPSPDQSRLKITTTECRWAGSGTATLDRTNDVQHKLIFNFEYFEEETDGLPFLLSLPSPSLAPLLSLSLLPSCPGCVPLTFFVILSMPGQDQDQAKTSPDFPSLHQQFRLFLARIPLCRFAPSRLLSVSPWRHLLPSLLLLLFLEPNVRRGTGPIQSHQREWPGAALPR